MANISAVLTGKKITKEWSLTVAQHCILLFDDSLLKIMSAKEYCVFKYIKIGPHSKTTQPQELVQELVQLSFTLIMDEFHFIGKFLMSETLHNTTNINKHQGFFFSASFNI